MHVLQSLHQLLRKNCAHVHAARLTALVDVVGGLLRGQTLTVTGLGRATVRDISMKQGIKQSDRLVGNRHLTAERRSIYQAVAQHLIHPLPRPLVLVDWSDCTQDRRFLILRASVPAGGRALTLYEEVHPYACYGNPRVQRAFLKTLKHVLPADARPILITDAGFTSPWFKAVQALGWDYVGRLRSHIYYRSSPAQDWVSCRRLQQTASATPRYCGEVEVVRYRPFSCHLYLYKQSHKGRVKKTRYGHKALSKHSQKNAQRERAPWLLASSVSLPAKQLIRLYRTRMQIEQGFRDIKNHRTGFSMHESRTHSPERLANLLLIAMLATFGLWLLGRIAEAKGWHHHYQANTVRHTRTLSLFYLGILLLRGQHEFTNTDIKQAQRLVQQDMIQQWHY